MPITSTLFASKVIHPIAAAFIGFFILSLPLTPVQQPPAPTCIITHHTATTYTGTLQTDPEPHPFIVQFDPQQPKSEQNKVKIIFKQDKNGVNIVYDRTGNGELTQTDKLYIGQIINSINRYNEQQVSIDQKTKNLFLTLKDMIWKKTIMGNNK